MGMNVKHMYKPCPFSSSLYEEINSELFTVNWGSFSTPNKATHCVFTAACNLGNTLLSLFIIWETLKHLNTFFLYFYNVTFVHNWILKLEGSLNKYFSHLY